MCISRRSEWNAGGAGLPASTFKPGESPIHRRLGLALATVLFVTDPIAPSSHSGMASPTAV